MAVRDKAADNHSVRPGQVWRDADPRGGPTFRIVSIESETHALVENVHGFRRRRRVQIARIPRRYELVTDAALA